MEKWIFIRKRGCIYIDALTYKHAKSYCKRAVFWRSVHICEEKNSKVSSAGFSKWSPTVISYGEFLQHQLYSHSVWENSHKSALYSFHTVNLLVESYAGISCVCYTGWPRLIGSPKLQIIFHKRATKYRSLLRKMTYKDKGSYESSPLVLAFGV